MKHTLLYTHSFFTMVILMIASTSQMAVADYNIFSSDTCTDIDKKIMKLDRFTTMVNNTSAFHLEEKAAAMPVSGITVSTNKKKMLRDVKKKYVEYIAARQKHHCTTLGEAHTQAVNKKVVVSKSAKIDKKVIKTDTRVHKIDNVRAVDNVKVKTKHQREVEKMPIATQTADKKRVIKKQMTSEETSDTCAAINKKIIKLDEFTTMVNNTSAFHWEEKAAAMLVSGMTVSTNKKKMLRDVKKKYAEYTAVRQKHHCTTLVEAHTQAVNKKRVIKKQMTSEETSDTCAAINKKIIKLDEFTTMVNNTSAFHWEEKAAAVPVPGITVSTNKKNMLRSAKKKATKLLKEYQKNGCEPYKKQ